jgi:hypothetical protein
VMIDYLAEVFAQVPPTSADPLGQHGAHLAAG